MRRVVLSQLWRRRGRTLALLAGIFVAATSFTVLTGSSRSQRLDVRSTVASHYRASYDILVRPRGARSAVEQRQGLVRPGVLSGIFGGITLAQWHKVLAIPGVSVAAPIAVIGYALPEVDVPVDLTAALRGGRRTLFRVRLESVTDRGLSRQSDASIYVYVSRDRFEPNPFAWVPTSPLTYATQEIVGRGDHRPVCAERRFADSPWDPTTRGGQYALGDVQCWSTKTGLGLAGDPKIGFGPLPHGMSAR